MLPKVLINKFCEETGYTKRAIEGKIATGVWAYGKHYVKSPDGRTHINVEEYLKWVESQSTEMESKSRSRGMEKDIDQH